MTRGSIVVVVRLWLMVAVLGGGGGTATAQTQATPEPAVRWASYDVTLDVQRDGAIKVTERQVVEFRDAFRTGFANIPLREGESIDGVHVSVGVGTAGEPDALRHVPRTDFAMEAGTFTFAERPGVVEIDYAFEPTRLAGDTDANTRVIVLEYTFHGAIRDVEASQGQLQEIWWIAIASAVTEVAPVMRASVTIILPEPVPLEETAAVPEADDSDGQAFVWEATRLDAGGSLEVRLRFPAIAGAATPAATPASANDPARMPGLRASEMRY